ncbi:hypothetical protein HG536_0B06520 [Torulaspora globosa]|uniref:Transcription activator GCR1-like domain-containing protein n=1 Tax=Torulaspora globosa TaxID=48254 RepID=A0A7G3ZE48_9SACH|nr:uncharacterized protein HG536_0B06520 [Torulaspora globosa]QLL31784.1 hypothetical protein HG536_0B06520 [Torulaspora globosa]
MHIDSDGSPRYVPNGLDSVPLAHAASFDDELWKSFYESDAVPPSNDTKYLDNKSFHYTSSFQIRPQVEYFDFDERYAFNATEQRAEVSGERDEAHKDTIHYAKLEDDAPQEVAGEDFRPECENITYSGDDYIEQMATKIDLCKHALELLIKKIDQTTCSTIPYRNTEQHISLAREISDLLSLVNYENMLQSLISGDINGPRETDTKAVSISSATADASARLSNLLRDDPCATLPNFGVILLKSPATIAQLWDEYTKVPSEWPVTDILSFTRQQGILNSVSNIELVTKRKTSIRQLEQILGSSWRNNDKNFSRQINRRKKIWKAIEDGLRDGVPLQECFSILETYAKERNKGLSWYYNGVPFALSAMPPTER